MAKFHFTTFILLFFLFSFGQQKTKESSININEKIIKVTLLGTGTPQPDMERFGPSILVEAGDKTLLFDAGRGCLQRLYQLNKAYAAIDALFFTHLHSDHIVGLPDLWLTGWLTSRRNIPLTVFGPKGCEQMTDYLQKAYAFDIKMRIEDDKASPEGSKLTTNDIAEGVVYEKSGVKVTAFLVDHYPIIPAFGYRVEYNGHSIVLSGDTRYSENLIKYAKGTDLLVHEVALAPDTLGKTNPKYHILAHHTTLEQAGKIFNIIKPRLAVYSHIGRLYELPAGDIFRRTKISYSGPLVLGEDLMSFSVGDTVIVKACAKK